MKNTFKIVSLEGSAPWIFVVFALAYGAQLFLGLNLNDRCFPSLSEQWMHPSAWVFAGVLYMDSWPQALALLLTLAVTLNPLQRAWGARSLLLQLLAVSLLSARLGQVGDELVPVFAWPLASYLWMGMLVRSPESLGLDLWSKFFRLCGVFMLWIAILDALSTQYGEQSNVVLGVAMGSVLGLILYWIARILGWFVQMVKLKRGLVLPPLGLALALGHWWIQVKDPRGIFLDQKNLWVLDHKGYVGLEPWLNQVWNSKDLTMKVELAQRCLLGMNFPCDPKLAQSILQSSGLASMSDLAELGYIKDFSPNQKAVLQRFEGLKQPAGMLQSVSALQVLCGSRDSALSNPAKGLEMAERLMAQPWPMDLGIEAPYSACLFALGRKAEAESWAYRAMQKSKQKRDQSWLYELDYRLNLDSYFRIRAGQRVHYPEQIWIDSGFDGKKILTH